MELYFEIAGSQIDGAREYQEDAFLTTYVDDESGEPKAAALVVMADGMGGHAAGNIASNLVVSTFNQTFTSTFGKQDVASILRDALIKANNGLSESIRETPALDGMGCTMVSAALCRGKVWWVSVGDSHLYLVRDRELLKKNEDHSYGGYLDRMAAQGMDVEPEPGLSRNMLMSAMTGEDIAEIDCPTDALQLLAGDRLIVASDGLDTLSTGTIIQMSTWSSTPKECVEALLKAVEDAAKPRQDNTTVIVVDIVGREAKAPPPPVAQEAPKPKERDPDATQPLDLAEIEAALKRERDAQQVVHREADYDVDEERGSRGKWLVVGVFVALLLLGGGGYLGYTQGWFGGVLPGPGASPPPTPEPPKPAPPKPAPPKPEPEPPKPEPPKPEPPKPEPPEIPAGEPYRDKLGGGGDGPLMVPIAAGTFRMGSSGFSVDAEERPDREVRVSAFAMSKHEVTIAEYERFANATGRQMPATGSMEKGSHPIVSVTWDDALAYTQWLSQQTGARYRLPSEAEWEYAARAGTNTPYWWGFEFKTRMAHCFDCDTGLDPRRPTAVGRFDPNPFGLYDMTGNVLEWVYDCFHANYQGAPGTAAVWEGGDCSVRVARGGSFSTPSTSLKHAKRSRFRSTSGFDNVGFRVVAER